MYTVCNISWISNTFWFIWSGAVVKFSWHYFWLLLYCLELHLTLWEHQLWCGHQWKRVWRHWIEVITPRSEMLLIRGKPIYTVCTVTDGNIQLGRALNKLEGSFWKNCSLPAKQLPIVNCIEFIADTQRSYLQFLFMLKQEKIHGWTMFFFFIDKRV